MSHLKIVPLGGMGKVTQNIYLYIYEDEIFIVDCGIGFPDRFMPGVDILIPDITYLLSQVEQGRKIVGMLLSHAHDDHIAALPYVLPDLPDFPLYGSPLTAAFAQQRMKEGEVQPKVNLIKDKKPFKVGTFFTVTPYAMTHSVPDTKHYTIETPAGIIYHGTDFKLDKTPVDGVKPDLEAISKLAEKNILCMLVDCLRVERAEWTPSESTTGPAIEAEMRDTKGKFIITLMSSHLHRIQQTINAAVKHGRKVTFIGRSVEQNVRIATELGKIHVPDGFLVDKNDLSLHSDDELCIVIAGSQGQEGSSLVRAIYGDSRQIKITPEDKVVFSADAIPGNELTFYGAIDELSRGGIQVIYPAIRPALHSSGHASAAEQKELVGLLKPEYVMPIGGADRHRVLFIDRVAKPLGFDKDQVLVPLHGEVIGFDNRRPSVTERIEIYPRTVDGLGVGDVGPKVLSDRRAMSQAGIIVLLLPRFKGRFQTHKIQVISRGFVFMKEALEVIEFIKKETTSVIKGAGKQKDIDLKRAIERRVGRKLYKIIRRDPMIVPVILEERGGGGGGKRRKNNKTTDNKLTKRDNTR